MILRPVAGGRGFAPRATTWVVWLRFARRSGYVQETTTAQWAMVIATGVNERTGAAVGQATHLRILGQTSVREEEIMGSRSKNSPLNRQSRAEHLDKLLDEALEQTFPASDPVAIDFERSGDSSGCCRARPNGRMRQQSVEKTPGAASIALPREQRPACGAVVDATLMTCASALRQDRDMALAQR